MEKNVFDEIDIKRGNIVVIYKVALEIQMMTQ